MDAFKAQVRKAVVVFIVVDVIFLGLALALYFLVFTPRLDEMAAARDEAVRTGIAMQVRVRAVEGRYALTVMDLPAARVAAGDVRAQLSGLAGRIPDAASTEAAEVKQLIDRAALVESALEVDPHAARKDLEVIEAKLAALYPAFRAE
jgi:hypothetical protein